MKKLTIISMLLLSIMLGGCDDFLEPKSNSEFTPKEASSLNELLLGEAYPRSDDRNLNTFLCLLDDDVAPSLYQEANVGSTDIKNSLFAPYTWQSDMCITMEEAGVSSDSYNLYKKYYSRILGANAILDYLPTVTGTPEELASVEAQAHILRAFFYFHLVNCYGAPYNSNPDALGVPLKLKSGIEEDRDLTRNTVAEVYEVIVSDLLRAEELYKTLPDAEQWQANYRTSLPLAQLLLARVYLFMENWGEAAAYAQKVMENNRFQVYDLRTAASESGKVAPFDFHSYNISNENIWLYGNVNDMTDWVYNSGKGASGYPFFKASDGLMDSFGEGDLRKSCYVVEHGRMLDHWDENNQPVMMPQAFGKVNLAENGYQPANGTLTFGRSFRVSEAHLTYCEAKAMLAKEGNATAKGEAENALNNFRQYRIAADKYETVSFNTVDELIAFIKDERRREFCFEDFRWYDLRRWGMPEIKHEWHVDASTTYSYTLKEKDAGYTLPIPNEAIELNPALVQNPLAEEERTGEVVSSTNGE